ncbi:hypothetical protein [Dactylosporangium sp. NPDC006015]|uniref:hypothetical protein n=1 Tax=Dactylosporangium sp. NPDC006015 TaxID=3154576 RepID=UPI0033AD904E
MVLVAALLGRGGDDLIDLSDQVGMALGQVLAGIEVLRSRRVAVDRNGLAFVSMDTLVDRSSSSWFRDSLGRFESCGLLH